MLTSTAELRLETLRTITLACVTLTWVDFENAIVYLDKFDGNDEVLSVLAKAGIGDAFLELGQNDEALSYYKKALATNNNKFVIPLVLMKAAIVSEMQDDYKGALKYYERIKSDFGDSREASRC